MFSHFAGLLQYQRFSGEKQVTYVLSSGKWGRRFLLAWFLFGFLSGLYGQLISATYPIRNWLTEGIGYWGLGLRQLSCNFTVSGFVKKKQTKTITKPETQLSSWMIFRWIFFLFSQRCFPWWDSQCADGKQVRQSNSLIISRGHFPTLTVGKIVFL